MLVFEFLRQSFALNFSVLYNIFTEEFFQTENFKTEEFAGPIIHLSLHSLNVSFFTDIHVAEKG